MASRFHRVVDLVFLGCQLIAAVVLVAFIVGSLVFTGGRVLSDGEQLYDEAWSWPVFPVPAWLLIVPAAIAALVVVPLVITTRVRDADHLIGCWGQTIVAVGAGVLFAVAFPADGPVLIPRWTAAALSAFCFVVLAVGMAAKLPAYERLRRTEDAA